MLRTYLTAGAIITAQVATLAYAMNPDVSDLYRSVYIDRATACYPLPVDGNYRLGQQLSFGTDQGRLRQDIVRCGLRDPDPVSEGSWSDGEKTVLRFAIRQPAADLALDVEMWPYVPAGIAAQRIAVSANGHPVADLNLGPDSPSQHRISIPRRVAQPVEGFLEITFDYPDARSPHDLGLGNDRRKYALFFRTLRLSAEYPPPK